MVSVFEESRSNLIPHLRTQRFVKGRCGGYAKVITPGAIRPGESIDVHHAARDRS